jgi:signal transduction histidine kinase
MVRLRWLVGLGILMTILLADRITEATYDKPPLYVIVAGIFIYNLLFDFWMPRLGPTPSRTRLLVFANLQLGLDIAALFFLVAFTGGVQNLFVFYAIFHLTIGSILLPRRNLIAVTAIICLGALGLFWLDHLGVIPAHDRLDNFLPPSVHENRTYVFGLSYIFVTLAVVTAYMSYTISRNLRDSQRRLIMLTREIGQQREVCAEQNRGLVDLEAKKSEFLRAAGARLFAPLREVHAVVSAVVEEGALPHRRAEFEKAQRQTEVLLELVDDMLETDRLRRLEIDLPREEVDLAAMARKVAEVMEGLAQKMGVELKAVIAADLPVIQGDPLGWPKVFHNLLENAIRYSNPGSKVEFRLERDWQGEWIKGEVRDQGMGIRKEDLAKIFEEFHRSDQAERIAAGTGMGLPIVKKVVELHGGKIEVESKPQRGSVFRFIVPVKAPSRENGTA